MKKMLSLVLVLMMLLCSVSLAEDADVLTPEQAEMEAALVWLYGTVPEEDGLSILKWDLDTLKEKFDGYDGELKYCTKDQLAEAAYEQIEMMNQFMEAVDNVGEAFIFMDPAFDGTRWVGENQVIECDFQDGYYKVAVAPSFEDLENGVNTLSYLCDLDMENMTLKSIGTGMEDNGQADQGLGSTFAASDDEHGVGILTWTDASGKATEFAQMDERFLGAFVSENAAMMIAWQDGYYKVNVGKTVEDIENDADIRSYLCYQGLYSLTLTGIGTGVEGMEQADEGIGYFTYDDFADTITFMDVAADGAETVFTRAAE